MSDRPAHASFETSGGATVHRLRLEAFPGFWCYVYVVQHADHLVLIDTGSGTDSSHENLLSGFQDVGIGPSDLTHIFLTHAHIDHFGGLSRLRAHTRAKIGCHELDVQTITRHDAHLALMGQRLSAFLAESGLAEEVRSLLLQIYRFTGAIYHSVSVDFLYDPPDNLLGSWEVIHLPGHCPGHVALRLDDVVFCGDLVVEGVTPHLAPESLQPYGGLDHYLASLERFQAWAGQARLILNGHNDPITDLTAQVEATKHNILRRMSRAVEALSQPSTVAEVCQAVYGNLEGYNLLLVIEKTGAYVEYLYTHGMVEITNPQEVERGSPARYRLTAQEPATVKALAERLKMDTARTPG
jgi:glyoxylase-like metal-dependent hydrolase (beta-lactamase superfamily II)